MKDGPEATRSACYVEQTWPGFNPGLLRSVAMLILGLALLTGCGSTRATSSPTDGDRRALSNNINPDLAGAFLRSYSTLAEMLAGASDSPGAADAVTVGRITEVAPGNGYIDQVSPLTQGGSGPKVVDFDSSEANWRTLHVTVAVEESLGGESMQSLILDWRIFGSSRDGEDWKAISRALLGSGKVMVMSKQLPDSPEFGGLRRILTDPPYQFAQLDDVGRITFPYIEDDGEGPSGPEFLGNIKALSDVRDLW